MSRHSPSRPARASSLATFAAAVPLALAALGPTAAVAHDPQAPDQDWSDQAPPDCPPGCAQDTADSGPGDFPAHLCWAEPPAPCDDEAMGSCAACVEEPLSSPACASLGNEGGGCAGCADDDPHRSCACADA